MLRFAPALYSDPTNLNTTRCVYFYVIVKMWFKLPIYVAGTPRLEDALRFVRFATTGESLAAVAHRISYGPACRAGEPLVTMHVATGVEMAPHMPTSTENAARASETTGNSGWTIRTR